MVWLLYSMNKVTIKLYEYLTKQYIGTITEALYLIS